MPEDRTELTVNIKGVVLPSWVAGCLAGAFVLASIALLFLWQATAQQTREIRLLQLHAQDIESVMIQKGMARRGDFAPWDERQKRSSKKGE